MKKVLVLALLVAVVGGAWGQAGDLGKSIQDAAKAMQDAAQAAYDRQNYYLLRVEGRTRVSFRDVAPVLTESERIFAVNEGYYCTSNPEAFYVSAVEVSAENFLNAMGFSSYFEEKKKIERTTTIWGISAIALGLAFGGYFAYRGPDAEVDLLGGGLGVGACVCATGWVLSLYAVPDLPSFRLIASRANERTRMLMYQR